MNARASCIVGLGTVVNNSRCLRRRAGDVVNALAGVALQALTALTARRQQAAGCHLDPSKR